jgi:hypothetical protein
VLQRGTNELTLTADSVIAPADRGADPRELAFAMQTSGWKKGSGIVSGIEPHAVGYDYSADRYLLRRRY